MYKVHCLNNISPEGLALLTDQYELVDDIEQADAVLVRSANMHEMAIPANLKVVARAGAGVNNIPLEAMAEAGAFSAQLEELDADTAFILYKLADSGLSQEDVKECAVLRSAGAPSSQVAPAERRTAHFFTSPSSRP